MLHTEWQTWSVDRLRRALQAALHDIRMPVRLGHAVDIPCLQVSSDGQVSAATSSFGQLLQPNSPAGSNTVHAHSLMEILWGKCRAERVGLPVQLVGGFGQRPWTGSHDPMENGYLWHSRVQALVMNTDHPAFVDPATGAILLPQPTRANQSVTAELEHRVRVALPLSNCAVWGLQEVNVSRGVRRSIDWYLTMEDPDAMVTMHGLLSDLHGIAGIEFTAGELPRKPLKDILRQFAEAATGTPGGPALVTEETNHVSLLERAMHGWESYLADPANRCVWEIRPVDQDVPLLSVGAYRVISLEDPLRLGWRLVVQLRVTAERDIASAFNQLWHTANVGV